MATKVLHGINLTFQKRMAMAILKCGQRKVWLDPTKKPVIEEARTRKLPCGEFNIVFKARLSVI